MKNKMTKFSWRALLTAAVCAFALAACGGGGGGGGGSGSSGTTSTAPKSISSYSLGGVTGTINSSNHTIAVTVPYGTTVTALVASFTYSGANITVGGTAQVSGVTANDFTNPVVYTVTATDGTSVNYTVTVTVAQNPFAKAITAFSLSGGWTGEINEAAKTISVNMPSGTSVTALVATFTTTGQSVTVNGVTQVSGTTANDFTSPVIYKVADTYGTTASYTVTVTLIPPVTVGGTLNGLANGNSIGLADNGTDLLSLTANGAFTFAQTLTYGSPYSVTIPTLPTGQPCTSTYNAGTVASSVVNNVNVICGPTAVGTFNATGSLATARYDADATLLPNGKVLVSGGEDVNSYTSPVELASAEVYDPALGTWSSGSSMSFTRYGHTSTLLPNGKVLVAGGYTSSYNITGPTLASAELYDPATNSWSMTGSMSRPREFATATLLPNGKVLVAGGSGDTTAELYDPATGTWTLSAGSMSVTRMYGSATLLPNGKVLLAGGTSSTSNGSVVYNASADLYDPAIDTFTATGSMATGRAYQTATLMPNGKVLVTGGEGANAYAPVLASAEVYDPALGTWSSAGNMSVPRYGQTATLLPTGKVLVAGGNATTVAELYDPAAGTWANTGSMSTARFKHTATLLANGELLICGGEGSTSALNTCELYW